MSFLERLADEGVIKKREVEEIETLTRDKGLDLEDILTERGIDEEKILKLKSSYLRVPSLSVEPKKVTFEVLKYIPEESAVFYKFVPLAVKDGVLEVGLVDPEKIVEDAPVTKIVAVIIRHATEGNASDIHIENTGDRVKVRFRVDGILHTSLFLPIAVYSAVVARIKILANMKLDEKRKPQDGRFSARMDGHKIDIRVSTFPSYHGEKVEMRILDADRGIKTLDELGLTPKNLSAIRSAITRPYGIILIS